MKVLFVLPNIAVGGVERVRLHLIEHLSGHGIECRLALRHCCGELLDYARGVAPIDELAPRGLYQLVPALARVVRREQPSHVVSAFPDLGVMTWLALRLARSQAKWIETVDVSDAVAGSGAGLSDRLRLLLLSRAAAFVHRRVDAVVAVSEGVRAELTGAHAVDARRVVMLYNPVVPDAALVWQRPPGTGFRGPSRLVAVGRLTPQKGFDILIRAMAQVRGACQLDIWGEGPERTRLVGLVDRFGQHDRVRLRGYAPDPFRVMRDADVFVMPSRFEGFGNVLVEALACQCQIVAADCPHGPREILLDGLLGQLVPVEDAPALANAIDCSIDDRKHVSAGLLLERARDFSVTASGNRWRQLLHHLDA